MFCRPKSTLGRERVKLLVEQEENPSRRQMGGKHMRKAHRSRERWEERLETSAFECRWL